MKSLTADVVIAGGGIIGLAVAERLVRHNLRILVVDRQVPGGGRSASWAAGGIIPPASVTAALEPLQRLRGLSYAAYPSWVARIEQESGMDVEFLRSGGLHIARSLVSRAMLKIAQQQWHEEGVESTWLEPQELIQIEPGLESAIRCDEISGAVFVPGEFQIRPTRILPALRKVLEEHRIPFVETSDLPRVAVQSDRIVRLQTSHASIECHKLVICAGPWSRTMLQSLGSLLNLEPRRGQIALMRIEPGQIRHILNEGPRYVIPRRDGHVLIGSTVEDVGFNPGWSEDDVGQLVHDAQVWIEPLRGTRIISAWSGLRPYTADGLPILGPMPNHPQVVVATGHFRAGYELAPVTAEAVEQSLGFADSRIDLVPFRPNRF